MDSLKATAGWLVGGHICEKMSPSQVIIYMTQQHKKHLNNDNNLPTSAGVLLLLSTTLSE